MKTELPLLSDSQKKIIEEFQCPGCVCGVDTSECKAFKLEDAEGMFRCTGHVPGTQTMQDRIILGLPRPFARFTMAERMKGQTKLRLWGKEKHFEWDKFNVPVWAMVKDGYLFVRTFMPRLDDSCIDVVEGGTLDMVPGALDVNTFLNEIG